MTQQSIYGERLSQSALPQANALAFWGLAIAIAVAMPFVVPGFTLFQFTMLMVYAIAIQGLNILTGFTGLFSLGHSAFFAFGAYVGAIAIEHFGVHYSMAPLIGGLACLVLGYAIGVPASRLAGVYLALSTFALSVAAPSLLKLSVFQEFTGGVQGLYVSSPKPPSFLPVTKDQWIYFVVLAWFLVFVVVGFNLLRSRSGRAMLAVRDNQIAAKAAGVNVVGVKASAFALSAFYTGAAGALGALTVHFISPDSYTLFFSIALLVGLVIGGVGSIPGSLAGAAFILFVPNLAGDLSKTLSGAVYGLCLLAVVYVMPDGAAGIVKRLVRLVQDRLLATSRTAD